MEFTAALIRSYSGCSRISRYQSSPNSFARARIRSIAMFPGYSRRLSTKREIRGAALSSANWLYKSLIDVSMNPEVRTVLLAFSGDSFFAQRGQVVVDGVERALAPVAVAEVGPLRVVVRQPG